MSLPVGGVGELCLRSAGNLKEYWNRKEATEEAITADGWFRTGDIARVDEQGYVPLLGADVTCADVMALAVTNNGGAVLLEVKLTGSFAPSSAEQEALAAQHEQEEQLEGDEDALRLAVRRRAVEAREAAQKQRPPRTDTAAPPRTMASRGSRNGESRSSSHGDSQRSLTLRLAPAGALLPSAATGPIATVATCSGTDALAAGIAVRTGAIAEAMEGAAVLHAARLLGAPAIELRSISNRTGDRDRQDWKLSEAFEALRSAAAAFSSA